MPLGFHSVSASEPGGIKLSRHAQQKAEITRGELAEFIEQHGTDVLELILSALRDGPRTPSSADGVPIESPKGAPVGGRLDPWRQVGVIEDFVARWPDGPERYGPMAVYESRDANGPVRLAIGQPKTRRTLYGLDRGWVSVWHVVNGRPLQQLANFLEADDFETTGDRAALISGKDGTRKKGFAPAEQGLLPTVYRDLRIEIHRDRLNGPKARNRLAVIATTAEVDAMLDHALAHLHLRS
jgi:hypothetical protein